MGRTWHRRLLFQPEDYGEVSAQTATYYLPVGHEHDLACHASLPEQLVRVSCLGKRKSLRDDP